MSKIKLTGTTPEQSDVKERRYDRQIEHCVLRTTV